MTLDKALVEALQKDYTTAPISAQDRVMLDHVVKLTKDATKVGKDDIEGLRAAGFDDRGILQITLNCVVVQLHQPSCGRAGSWTRVRPVKVRVHERERRLARNRFRNGLCQNDLGDQFRSASSRRGDEEFAVDE